MGSNQNILSQTFSKSERIYKKKDIQELFSKSSSFYLYPFSIKYTQSDSNSENSILISVSKRGFKKAVDRNLLKRRIRESYRINKNQLLKSGLHVAFVYTSKKEHDFSLIEERMIKILQKLSL
jgi:ribonuclease P protein component